LNLLQGGDVKPEMAEEIIAAAISAHPHRPTRRRENVGD